MANPNTSASLDLYANIEDLLENREAIEDLYAYYYEALKQLEFDALLDVGCGSGDFLLSIQKYFSPKQLKGIDLSPVMVERTLQKGIDAQAIDLCMLEGKYDIITAVFDMVNYLPREALKEFMQCIKEHLNAGGYFIFDINTLFGFENVAVGSHIVEDESRFLAVDSDFESGHYEALFTLFVKDEDGKYGKEQKILHQTYHEISEIVTCSGMELIVDQELSLYGLEEADKVFVVLKKV